MLVSEFLSLANAGYPLEDIKKLVGRDFSTVMHTVEEMKRMMHFVKKSPKVMFNPETVKYNNDKAEAEKKWEMPDLGDAKFESVTDFSSQTLERIKITVDDYTKYFDDLLSEDDEDNVTLHLEVYSADGTDSFMAELTSPARTAKEQEKYKWMSEISYTDPEFWYLLSYVIAVSDSSSALNVTVAEGIARGKALYRVFLYAGRLLNSRFTELFKDFFSQGQN